MDSNKNNNSLGWLLGAGALVVTAIIWFFVVTAGDDFEDFPVARINGLDITYSQVRASIPQVENGLIWDYFELFEEWDIDHDREFREGLTFGEYLLIEAVNMAAFTAIYRDMAQSRDIGLSSADEQMINDHINGMIMEMGRDNFNAMLAAEGIQGRSHLADNLASQMIFETLIFAILDDEEDFSTFEGYMADDGVEAARERAEELLARALAGEDFDVLISLYGEDPGMWSNPGGYSFTTGVMVPEFEEATRNLEVGEISELVQTSHGFHIIMRTEPSTDPEDIMGDPEADEILGAKHILISATSVSLFDRQIDAIFDGIQAIIDNGHIEHLDALHAMEL